MKEGGREGGGGSYRASGIIVDGAGERQLLKDWCVQRERREGQRGRILSDSDHTHRPSDGKLFVKYYLRKGNNNN